MPSLKFYTVLSDLANVLAGLTLILSFSLIMAVYTFKADLGKAGAGWIQATMTVEGFLWFIGGFALAKIFIHTGNAAGAVSQSLISIGGLFFAVSGWNSPIYIVSLRYIVPVGKEVAAGNDALVIQGFGPALDIGAACPFYGILCFMIATTAGLIGVLGLPKDKIISPFWGVLFFFFGAWIIGVFALWGPLLLGGFKKIEDYDSILNAPIASKYTHPFQVLGAIFLTAGAVVFAIMNNSPPPPPENEKLMDDDSKEAATA
jgi:hypothetical protein